MRLLIIALAALPSSAALADPPGAPRRSVAPAEQRAPDWRCPTQFAHRAGPGSAEFRKLAELPPADAFHAVYRRGADGCMDPVMVGYQYGRRYRGTRLP